VRAKPALPVAGVPMVRRILRWLASSGITDVVLNLHHHPESIAAVVGDAADLGLHVRYSWEQPQVLGSAGGPRQALDIVGAESFVLANGDTLTDLALAPLASAHRASGALVTMAVVPNQQPDRYSGLRVDADGAVLGVVPKGSRESSFHFIGVQIAHRDAFAAAPVDRPSNSIGEIYDALIASRPGSIRVHHCTARFWDIGTVADYWATSHEFAEAELWRDDHVPSGNDATIDDCLIWDRVRIAPGATLRRCIVTDDVHVAGDARYAEAILMRGPDGGTIAEPFSPGPV